MVFFINKFLLPLAEYDIPTNSLIPIIAQILSIILSTLRITILYLLYSGIESKLSIILILKPSYLCNALL